MESKGCVEEVPGGVGDDIAAAESPSGGTSDGEAHNSAPAPLDNEEEGFSSRESL